MNLLPLHPTARHPRTGAPLRALWVRPDGRVMWPILGASPDEPSSGGTGGDTKPASEQGAQGQGTQQAGQQSDGGDTGRGDDLGFPRDTPVAEMTDKQQAAYYKQQSRKHENRVKTLVGDRRVEDVQHDLSEFARLQREQQTPAEQALTDRFEQGKREGVSTARTEAATAIFRGALESGGVTGDDLDELVDGFNVGKYVGDAGIDTARITAFAKRFTPAGTANDSGDGQRRRDFGAGQRRQGTPERGAGGRSEAARRFNRQQTITGS